MFRVTSIKIGQNTIRPPARGITIFTGPNNSGKTRTLNEIEWKIKNPKIPRIIVNEVKIKNDNLSDSDLENWVKKNLLLSADGHRYELWGNRSIGSNIRDSRGHLINLSVERLGVEDRITNFRDPRKAEGGYDYFNPERDKPESLSHLLLKDNKLQEEVYGKTEKILGSGLSVSRYSHGEVLRLVGKKFLKNNSSPEQGGEWHDNPIIFQQLENQGHGIQAVINIIGVLTATKASIITIDEPELFLHPPLAYKMGQFIGTLTDKQIFIATHSEHIMNGILSKAKSVEIIRLEKKQGSFISKKLEPKKVKELWDDARLRYTRLPQGLFCDLVVLCENNTDCMFYAAAKDAYFEKQHAGYEPEFCFVDVNGKNAIHKYWKILQELHIPVVCITDIDYLILRKNEGVKAIKEMEKLLDCKIKYIKIETKKIRKKIKIDGIKSPRLTLAERNQLKTEIENLKKKGVFVLSEGSLESFDRGIRHNEKADWLAVAMGEKVFKKVEPQKLLSEIISFYEDNSES